MTQAIARLSTPWCTCAGGKAMGSIRLSVCGQQIRRIVDKLTSLYASNRLTRPTCKHHCSSGLNDADAM